MRVFAWVEKVAYGTGESSWQMMTVILLCTFYVLAPTMRSVSGKMDGMILPLLFMTM